MAFDDLTPSQREPLIALIEALATGDYHDEFAMARRAMERRGDIHLYGKSGAKDRQLEGFTDSDTQVLMEEGYLSRSGLKATLKAKAYQQYNLLKDPSDSSANRTDSVDVHLRRLLKVYRATDGRRSKSVVLTEVFKDENLSDSDSWKEADYMEGEGWIAVLANNGPPYVRLTHRGIKRAEAALAIEESGEGERRGTASPKSAEAMSPIPNATDSRNVFVVHGRNLEARNSLFRFLRSIGLRPLEWSQAIQLTGKASPFIGEILDVAFSNAQAVVVLMTPDDVAQLQEPFRSPHDPPYEAQPTGQARPNVLFEAGMAMGRHPDRTIIVELGIVRPFSDIAGRHTVRLSNDSAARQELAQRLETAGCAIDLSGRDWHTEGDFKVTSVEPPPKARNEDGRNLAETFWDFRQILSNSEFGHVVVYSFFSNGHGRYISSKEYGDFSWEQLDDQVVIVRADRGEFILTRMGRDYMSGYFYPPIKGGFKLKWSASMRD